MNLNNLVDKRLRTWTFGRAESSGFLTTRTHLTECRNVN